MTDQLQNELQQILTELKLPKDVTVEQSLSILSKYIVEPTSPPPPSNVAGEDILVALDEIGAFRAATTDKIPNLKFRLSGVIEEALRLSTEVPGAIAFPPKIILVALESYRRMCKLATIQMDQSVAELLLVIYRLIQDHQTPTVDLVTTVAQETLSEIQIINGLETLEILSCIAIDNGKIELHETIIVKQEPAK